MPSFAIVFPLKREFPSKNLMAFMAVGVTLLSLASYSMAQPAPQDAALAPPAAAEAPAAPSAPAAPEAAMPEQPKPEPMAKGGPVFDPAQYAPILFTYWEHAAIQDARSSRGLVRPLSESELEDALNSRDDGQRVRPPPEEREIRLSGIVYNGGKDWTIWLNGKRVTPDALPREVLDLKVFKSYVEMKWFDEYTNQIFPLRLRPHQRFNIDTRIFLPG